VRKSSGGSAVAGSDALTKPPHHYIVPPRWLHPISSHSSKNVDMEKFFFFAEYSILLFYTLLGFVGEENEIKLCFSCLLANGEIY